MGSPAPKTDDAVSLTRREFFAAVLAATAARHGPASPPALATGGLVRASPSGFEDRSCPFKPDLYDWSGIRTEFHGLPIAYEGRVGIAKLEEVTG